MTPAEIMAASRQRAVDPWWTVDEIAADMRISRMTVYRACKNDYLRSIKVGRLVRIRNSWLNAWLDAGAETGGDQ